MTSRIRILHRTYPRLRLYYLNAATSIAGSAQFSDYDWACICFYDQSSARVGVTLFSSAVGPGTWNEPTFSQVHRGIEWGLNERYLTFDQIMGILEREGYNFPWITVSMRSEVAPSRGMSRQVVYQLSENDGGVRRQIFVGAQSGVIYPQPAFTPNSSQTS